MHAEDVDATDEEGKKKDPDDSDGEDAPEDEDADLKEPIEVRQPARLCQRRHGHRNCPSTGVP